MFNIIINNLPLSCFIKTGTVLLLPYKENKYLGLSVITNPEYFIHSDNQNIIIVDNKYQNKYEHYLHTAKSEIQNFATSNSVLNKRRAKGRKKLSA